tara:strand:- start:1157 stop:1423 length:267 start_codon:yes stop_codon:yes gene_type:complete
MKLITLITAEVCIAELATVCSANDTILLRQDAVYLARRTDIDWPCQQVMALGSDVTVRQIAPVKGIAIINDAQWVQFAATASQVVLWR